MAAARRGARGDPHPAGAEGLALTSPTPEVVGGLDLAALTAAERRVVTGLLEVGRPRPVPDEEVARRLRDHVEGELAPLLEDRPADARPIVLGKTQLDALACDGRFLDLRATPFEWSAPTVRGQLVHRAIALDHHLGREVPTAEVLAHAWEEFAHSGDSALAFAGGLSPLEVAALQADAATAVEEHRATFPALPLAWRIAFEPVMVARFGAGAVLVRGKPDIKLGRVTADQRRILLLDLKTGNRSRRDRQDMRLYALLATLKYRQAPFKVATVYIDEGTWDEELVDDDVLEAAARQLVQRLRTALRLERDPVARELHAGPMCTWCGLAETCEERIRADRAHAAAG